MLFRILQRKDINPEILSTTRYFKFSKDSKAPERLKLLLEKRADAIEKFYSQLQSFSSSQLSEREKLTVISKLSKKIGAI